MKKAFQSERAPRAIGPYSPAIEAGEMFFCSGQIGLDAKGAMVPGGIEAETRCVMDNIRELLSEAGLSLHHIVKTTIYLIDLTDFDIVNRIYGEHFSPPYPARSTVQVSSLPRGAKLEIEAIAMKPR